MSAFRAWMLTLAAINALLFLRAGAGGSWVVAYLCGLCVFLGAWRGFESA